MDVTTQVALISAGVAVVTAILTSAGNFLSKRTEAGSTLALSDREQNARAFERQSNELAEVRKSLEDLRSQMSLVLADNSRLKAESAMMDIHRSEWQRERESWQKEREVWQAERIKWENEKALWTAEKDKLTGVINSLKDKLEAMTGESIDGA